MSHMTRATVVSSPAAAALLLTAVTVFLIYLIRKWSVAPIVTTTIDECGPGENPRTSICYDADLPNE